MVALISFLLVLTLSLVIERVATVALTLTGLSRDAAQFQARSAFTGTGFTTSEAEQLTTNPARRRIVMLLMGMRSVEIITGVSSLVLAFIGVGSSREGVIRGALISAGLIAIGLAATSGWVDRHLSRLIAWALRRWTTLDVRDYTTLLGLTSGYTVLEMAVDPDSWLAHRNLEDLGLPEEGVTVLAIQREDGSFVGAPHRNTVVRPRDTLVLYGHGERLAEINGRRGGTTGDQAHRDAVAAHTLVLGDQEERELVSQQRWHGWAMLHPQRPRHAEPLNGADQDSPTLDARMTGAPHKEAM